MDKREKQVEWIRKLPTWISGAVGLATAVISLLFIVFENYSLAIVIAGLLLVTLVLFALLYVAFAEAPSLIIGGRHVYRFPRFRLPALMGIGLIIVFVVVILAFVPSRSFVRMAFVGTATPTATSTPTPTSTSTPTPTATPTLTPTATQPTTTSDSLVIMEEIRVLRDEVALLQQRIDALDQTLPDSVTSAELAKVYSDTNSLNRRLEAIEQAILDNPAKVLQLTLLGRDMENLEQNYKADLKSVQEEVDRVYDQNKWFLGLMFTMAIGLISLAVSNFLTRPRKEEKRQADKPKSDE